MKSFAIAVLVRAVAYRLALDMVVPANSPRRERVTLGATFTAALLLSAVSGVAALLGLVPGVGLLVWVGLLAAWLYVFAVHFELRGAALAVLAVVDVLAGVAIKLAAWWLGW